MMRSATAGGRDSHGDDDHLFSLLFSCVLAIKKYEDEEARGRRCCNPFK